jgi:hypothetical protein
MPLKRHVTASKSVAAESPNMFEVGLYRIYLFRAQETI